MFTWIKGLMLSTALALGVLALGGATTTEEASAARWYRGGYYGSYYRPYYRPYYSYYRPYYGYQYYGTPRYGYYEGQWGSGVNAGPVRVRWW